MNQSDQNEFRRLARLRVPASLDPSAPENEVLNRVRAKGNNQRCILYQHRWGVSVETRTLLTVADLEDRKQQIHYEHIVFRGSRLTGQDNSMRYAVSNKAILVTTSRFNHNTLDAMVNVLAMFYNFDVVSKLVPDGLGGSEPLGESVVMHAGDDTTGPGFDVVVGGVLGAGLREKPMPVPPRTPAAPPAAPKGPLNDDDDDFL